jgi:hypothetical protein
VDVREEFEVGYTQGSGETLTKSRGRSRGWFVQFEGSYESIHFGPTRPHIEVGDLWRITFEKEPAR